MGKRLLVQRRGRGGSVFRYPKWKKISPAKYLSLKDNKKVMKGKITKLLHEPGRGTPLAEVKFEDKRKMYYIPPEGIAIGSAVYYGADAPTMLGSIVPIIKVPEGSYICNVELKPGDGGKIARSSGTYALVLSKSNNKVLIQLPSGKTKEIDGRCRATIGIVAGGGRTEKPFLKAGKVYHLARAKSWKYPTVRGKAMSPYAHPHGGGTHPTGGIPVSRNAPPGQKVGHIAPKRTGRRKR